MPYKLNIGDATHYLKWDGEKLMVKGLFGDITLENTGFVRTSGKDNYADLTAGFFLGYDGGAYKLNIGNSAKYIKWDGANLTIKGMAAFGSITLDSAGFIKTTGKDSYTDTTAGFWLGYSGGYKLNIGNNVNWLKWSGSALLIKGRLSVGADTNEDIYFEDSTIKLYDFGTGGGTGTKGIALKYSTENFLTIYHYPAAQTTSLILHSDESASRHMDFVDRATYGMVGKTYAAHHVNVYLWPNGADLNFSFYGTGQFQLPNLSSAPTISLSTGQLCIVSNVLKIYNGSAWVNV